jgi:hypothetical protein
MSPNSPPRVRCALAFAVLAALVSASGCGGASGGPSAATEPALTDPAACAGKTDAARVPLSDLGAGCYLSFQGGLYPNGSDSPPAAHTAAGLAAAAQIQPLDVDGQPGANGKIVLVSIGMSNTTQEFCSDGGLPNSCQSVSFMGQAAADPAVNHSTLVLVNGAYGGKSAAFWTSPTLPDYDRIRATWLQPLGLSEKQVQIAWVKVANPQPSRSLPASDADAFVLEQQLGQILRALKVRYPNMRQVFLSSRIYAGYATSSLNPEPYAYESGFAVKWTIESQIAEMAGNAPAARAGSLRYDNGTAPWSAWGPYLWANGSQPRSDGLTWLQSDFNTSDFTHPATGARQKVGAMLLSFFKNAPETQCWFLAGRRCR